MSQSSGVICLDDDDPDPPRVPPPGAGEDTSRAWLVVTHSHTLSVAASAHPRAAEASTQPPAPTISLLDSDDDDQAGDLSAPVASLAATLLPLRPRPGARGGTVGAGPSSHPPPLPDLDIDTCDDDRDSPKLGAGAASAVGPAGRCGMPCLGRDAYK